MLIAIREKRDILFKIYKTLVDVSKPGFIFSIIINYLQV